MSEMLELFDPMTLPLKCISLHQPWASFVAWEAKRFDTRGKNTHYRGELGIHAAKRPLVWEDGSWGQHHNSFHDGLTFAKKTLSDLKFGFVVGICTLVEIYKTEDLVDLEAKKITDKGMDLGMTQLDVHLGDYRPGRFAWRLKHAVAIEPIPYRGLQWLFDVPPELATSGRMLYRKKMEALQ